MYFKENLTYLREGKGLSRGQLAKIMEVTSSAVSAYEKGKNYPGIEKIISLSIYFKVSLDDFFFKKLSEEGFETVDRPMVNEPEAEYKLNDERAQLLKLQGQRIDQLERVIARHLPDVAREVGIDTDN